MVILTKSVLAPGCRHEKTAIEIAQMAAKKTENVKYFDDFFSDFLAPAQTERPDKNVRTAVKPSKIVMSCT